MMTTLVTYAVIAFVAYRSVGAIRNRGDAYRIAAGIRWRHLGWAVLAIAGVAAAAVPLYQVPGLGWGWWQLFGGSGSIAVGASDATSTGGARYVPAVMLLVLAVAVPPFAVAEERMFRAGSQHHTAAGKLRRALTFGLAHLLMGIPIALALALTMAGLVFTWAYMRAFTTVSAVVEVPVVASALSESDVREHLGPVAEKAAVVEAARVHITYNWLLVGFGALLTWVVLLAG